MARGHLIVPEHIAELTRIALRGFSGPDGRHEGIVFWLGRRVDGDHLVAAALVPNATHRIGGVHVDRGSVGTSAREAHKHRLVVLAQVHSHPGTNTHHSPGDDRLVLMPYEGMFSLVVARYGDGSIMPESDLGVHQYQDGHWVKLDDPESFIVVPSVMYQ